jgi:hypothetical protein
MAPTVVRSSQDVPDQARRVIQMVEMFGFKVWTFEWEHKLPDLDRRVQVRDDQHNRPHTKVAEIRQAYMRGEKLPPAILDKTGRIIDGNTRIAAKAKNHDPDIQAVVLAADYDQADDDTKRRMRLLGAAANLKNSISIDKKELRNAVVFAAEDTDYDAARLAVLLGKTEATIRAILDENKAKIRLEKVGLPLEVSLNGTGISAPAYVATVMRVLGRLSNRLNDKPFRELAHLTADAGLKAEEVIQLGKRIQEARSDHAAEDLLGNERQTLQDRIAHYSVTRKSKVSDSGQLRQRLGFITNFRDDPCKLVEHSDVNSADHVNAIRDAISVLRKVLECQQENDQS